MYSRVALCGLSATWSKLGQVVFGAFQRRFSDRLVIFFRERSDGVSPCHTYASRVGGSTIRHKFCDRLARLFPGFADGVSVSHTALLPVAGSVLLREEWSTTATEATAAVLPASAGQLSP